ncbi:hypothetical protein BDL97_02G183200 [Sphagnum fallax]|nr:hypothetical protein BDL97_02G183200 [Sphagnum fallax]
MCILCVASRWSRRIVTMLPWLIIPLIILWALSQLLPPNFRFEVTSPRLACVGVLLVSLGWYELAMPRLSQWRARRSAFLRERRRIEAQEAAKWRKEATRRCRNCWSAYRDQTPVGGKFMCTYCGHVSRRPVLDVPSGTHVAGIPAHLAQAGAVHSAATGMFSSRAGEGRGSTWAGRAWPYRMNPPLVVGFNRGWTNSGTPFGGGGTGGPYGPWPSYWGDGCGVCGVGSYGGGGLFGKDKCRWDSVLFSLFRVVSVVFVSLRWLWQKVWRDERVQEDPLSGSGRGSQRRGEDASGKEGSRGEKARRKAEEKRQARMEREQLEAEERRQREEVARLVEERRRLRDEKMEAERESEREAAAEREREIRREREAERRRQEKLKEKERDLIKERTSRDAEDSEDSKTDIKKMRDSKGKDSEKKTVEGEKKMDGMKPVPGQTNSGDSAKKVGKAFRAELSGKAGEVKMAGALKSRSGGVKGSVAANSKAHITNSTTFSGVGTTAGPKPLKGVSSPERERDPIKQVADGSFETSFGQGLSSSTYVAPIGPQSAIQVPASGLLQDRMALVEQPPQILEPWADESNIGTRRQAFRGGNELLGEEGVSGEGKWRMWEAPQLDHIQLPSVFVNPSPSPWMLPLGSRVSEQATPSPSYVEVSGDLGTQFPASLFGPQPQTTMNSGSNTVNCTFPVQLNSHSLWSDHSAFESAMRVWDDGDLLHQPHFPAEFIDCITQEVMQDPVITADGHTYERSAILRWLQTHDTSPITGEVLPPLPGVSGTVVDKTLRPNHILRGQIIEYRKNLACFALGMGMQAERSGKQESTSSRPGLCSTPWSTPSLISMEQPNNVRGFYTTPSSQSLWSYNIS